MPVSTRSNNPANNTPTVGDKAEDAMTEGDPTLADLMKEFKQGNADTKAQLIVIETSITANQKVVEEYIKKNDEALKTMQDKVVKLEKTVSTLETTVNSLSDDIEKLKTENRSASKKIEELGKFGKQQDEDKRKQT